MAQLAQSGQSIAPMTMAGMPCDMMMPAADADHGEPMMPCKGMTPDCLKHMGCVTDAALPAPLVSNEVVVHFSTVYYWPARSKLASLTRTPEPLPPRTA